MRKLIVVLFCFPLCRIDAQADVSFRDDFDDNVMDWNIASNENIETAVKDGLYHISHKRAGGYYWFFWKSIVANPDKDFSIESVITQESGVDNNGYGLVWGTKDIANAFVFVVASNTVDTFKRQ